MVARITCLALVLGFLVGCYNIPTPECGFACGPAGACPSSYACNTTTNRCELEGTQRNCMSAAPDAGIDADRRAPMVIVQIPADGSVGASLEMTVIARFDEPVIGVDDTTFRIEQLGSPVFGTVSYVATIDSANFQPNLELARATEYTAILTTGITDLAGNPLANEIRWTFTTAGDITPPMVVMRTPGVDVAGVDVQSIVTVDFSEPVIGVNGSSFTLTDGVTPIGGTVTTPFSSRAQLAPTMQLTANTIYTVRLTFDISDFAFNSLNPVTWSFTTGPDTVAPSVRSSMPADLASGIPTTATIVVEFDEPVLGVTTTSFTVNGGAITGTIAMSAGDTVATFTPDAALPPGTMITVDLTAAITDAATNALAPVAFSFTTAP